MKKRQGAGGVPGTPLNGRALCQAQKTLQENFAISFSQEEAFAE
jgi:hypothetical protein